MTILTHHNIVCNCDSLLDLVQHDFDSSLMQGRSLAADAGKHHDPDFKILTVIKGDVGAPIWLIEGLEIALSSIVDGPVSKLCAIIENHQASRLHNSCHFCYCLFSCTIWQLMEEVGGRHLEQADIFEGR